MSWPSRVRKPQDRVSDEQSAGSNGSGSVDQRYLLGETPPTATHAADSPSAVPRTIESASLRCTSRPVQTTQLRTPQRRRLIPANKTSRAGAEQQPMTIVTNPTAATSQSLARCTTETMAALHPGDRVPSCAKPPSRFLSSPTNQTDAPPPSNGQPKHAGIRESTDLVLNGLVAASRRHILRHGGQPISCSSP